MVKEQIIAAITAKRAHVGVVGLGYVGLPLLAEFAGSGFQATGFEVDENKAAQINAGESYIGDVNSSIIKDHRRGASVCGPPPISIILKTAMPSSSACRRRSEKRKSRMFPTSWPRQKRLSSDLHQGQLIILESTTYPGTTDEVLLPMFEETGLKLDNDFLLAFSPERVDPGNPEFQTHNIPKVVGGVTPDSTEAAAHLYSQIVKDVHAVSSARVAETAKLLENTFRAVNIGMANEMARLCYALNIDTWEVIRAAATKPFGFMPFYPGPGNRRPLYSARSALPVVEGPPTRL